LDFLHSSLLFVLALWLSVSGSYIPPVGAESFAQLYKRSGEFVDQVLLPLEGTYETVLVVAHGAIRIFQQGQLSICTVENRSCAVAHMHTPEIIHGNIHRIYSQNAVSHGSEWLS